ncbi:MAG: DUF1549 and DUF1553 domain-containing protein, partial [Pirellulales bacterium]
HKPTLQEPHEGGKRMEVDGWEHRLLARWIESGAKEVSESAPRLVELEVTPREIAFQKVGDTASLKAVAVWADGTRENVTPLCRFRTNDESTAEVSPDGQITCKTPGETHVVVFYDNGIAPIPVVLPVTNLAGDRYPDVPTATPIDRLVVAKLRKLGIVPSELAGDAEFLRRVNLDITGTLPATEEVQEFLADASADKRVRKIDELLNRPAYAAWWTTKLCDWTGNSGRNGAEPNLGDQAGRAWYDWIHHRVEKNVPYDKLIEGIVLATSREPGQSYEAYCQEMSSYFRKDNPADFSQRRTMPFYWTAGRRNPQPKEKALSFAYAFMGVRLQCAECHKHPFDQWTKDDFDQFTAFFQPLTYGPPPDARQQFNEMVKAVAGDLKGNQAQRKLGQMVQAGEVVPWRELFVARDRSGKPVVRGARAQRPKGKKKGPAARVVTPKLLGDDVVELERNMDPRDPLMAWLRERDNPYFARAFVNRVWASYFGVGIIDPPDDLNLANPPSNPELLDYLTEGFVEHGYDMRWLHREIATSRTYQLSWQPNDTNRLDTRHFSHAQLRRLPAEVTYDAIVMATASDNRREAMADDYSQRAIGPTTLAGGPRRNANASRYALMVFGKPARETNCDCERSSESTLLQTLFLRNDQEVMTLIDRKDGWVAEVAARYAGPKKIAQAAPADEAPKKATPKKKAGKKKGGKNAVAKGELPDREAIARWQARAKKLMAAGNKEQAEKLMRRAKKADMRLSFQPPQVPERGAAKPAEPKKKTEPPPPVAKRLAGKELVAVIEAAYMRTLSRLPTDEERARVGKHMAAAASPVDGLRDLMWVLVNSKEFIVNH